MARTSLALILVVLLLPLVVAANVAVWVSRTVVDAPAFTGTVDLALDGPIVDDLLEERATEAVLQAIDRLDPLVRGVALTALGLGADATPAAVRAVVVDRVDAVLETSLVRETRTAAVLDVHGLLTSGRTGRSDLIVVTGDRIEVDVRPVVLRALDTIDPRLVELALGAVSGGVTRSTLVELEGLDGVRAGIAWLDGAAMTLVALSTLVGLLAIVVARDRAGVLGWIGVSVALAGVIGLTAVWLGGEPATAGIRDATLRTIAGAVYAPLTEPLLLQSVVLVLVGGVLVVKGWVAAALSWTWSQRRPEPAEAEVDDLG